MFRISVVFLASSLLSVSCFSATTLHEDHRPNGRHTSHLAVPADTAFLDLLQKDTKKKASPLKEEQSSTESLPEGFLIDPSVSVSSKRYPIELDQSLKQKLEEKDSDITEKFLKRLKEIEKRTVSKRIKGFNIFLNQGKVYVNPYLGENAL